jgi:hypothetical protein
MYMKFEDGLSIQIMKKGQLFTKKFNSKSNVSEKVEVPANHISNSDKLLDQWVLGRRLGVGPMPVLCPTLELCPRLAYRRVGSKSALLPW